MIRILPLGRALITGASSAIGAIYAHRLATRGYDLVLAAADPKSLERFAGWMSSCTGSVIETIRFNAADELDLGRLLHRIQEDDELSMMVNNAASAEASAWPPPSSNASLFALNASAPARLAYVAAAAFAGRHRGAIVNVAPVDSLPPGGADTGCRIFFRTLSQSLDSELRGCGVRAQAVLPTGNDWQFRQLAEVRTENLSRDVILIAEDMVDQALAALDNGEIVSRPSMATTVMAREFRLDSDDLHRLRGHGALPPG